MGWWGTLNLHGDTEVRQDESKTGGANHFYGSRTEANPNAVNYQCRNQLTLLRRLHWGMPNTAKLSLKTQVTASQKKKKKKREKEEKKTKRRLANISFPFWRLAVILWLKWWWAGLERRKPQNHAHCFSQTTVAAVPNKTCLFPEIQRDCSNIKQLLHTLLW